MVRNVYILLHLCNIYIQGVHKYADSTQCVLVARIEPKFVGWSNKTGDEGFCEKKKSKVTVNSICVAM